MLPMDNPSALEEEALAIVSIYGPSSYHPLSGQALPATTYAQTGDTPVYALKVSLEEPDFDYEDPVSNEPFHSSLGASNSHSNSNSNNSISRNRNRKELELHIYFPAGYPESNTSAPVHEIVSIYYGALRLTGAMIEEIDRGLEECFVPGEVVVFSWIEWMRTYLEQLETRGDQDHVSHEDEEHDEDDEDQDEDEDEDQHEEGEEESHASEGQRAATDYFSVDEPSQEHHGLAALSSSLASLSILHPPTSASGPDSLRVPRASGVPVFNIRSGTPIIDRKSVFVAHLAPITQPGQVLSMIQQLKEENKKVAKATHNIMAFRVENDNGTIAQDNDDDGETAAGSRLLHLMSILDVTNVVVVVSRWYGGIPLSADRFKHINNAARLLLDECGYIKPAASAEAAASAGSKKKSKGKKAGKR